MAQSTRLVPLGPFVSGVDNRLPAHAMEDPDPRSIRPLLRSAVNVSVTNAGTLKRRPGTSRLLTGTDCHSLFSSDGRSGYYVDGNDLIHLDGPAAALRKTVVRSDMAAGRPVSFCAHPDGSVLYSNGVIIGRLVGVDAVPMNAPAVAPPAITVVPSVGSLDPGRYQIAFALRDESGQLGPASTPVTVQVEQNGAIDIGVRVAPLGYELVTYMTAANGSTLLEIGVGSAARRVATLPNFGARCFTLLKAGLPPGSIIRHHYGRTLVASGAVLFYSDVYSPLMTPSEGYVLFPAPVTMVQPCVNGVFVAADQTYWLPGDIATSEMVTVLPYGAVPGTGADVPNATACWWYSPRGVVVGRQDGSVENVQEGRVAVPKAVSGAGLFVERDGLKQMVVPTFGPSPSRMSAQSWMDAEVIRKGTEL